MLIDGQLTETIIGASMEVHKALGPGLLESAYEERLCREFDLRGVRFKRQVDLSIRYKGVSLSCGYRIDMIVASTVVVELTAIEHILPIHEAQLLTYLRLSGLRTGLLLNFNVPILRDGIVRRIL
jgi:GxxExxY protein